MVTIIKQYGERRTGTNYLRALVGQSFPDVRVLMYVLGDKHAPPVDLAALWSEARHKEDPAFHFISSATYASRGPCSHPDDLTQRAELRARAKAVARAYAERSLRYVVTVKDPYAWVVSLARFEQWVNGESALSSWDNHRLRDACLLYNTKYRAWLEHAGRAGEHARVVRYEDLMADPAAELGMLATQFGLRPSPSAPAGIRERVEPTVWDHLPVRKAKVAFDRTYYDDQRYLRQLQDDHLEIVTETIDWDLFGRLGYAPIESAVSVTWPQQA